MGKKLDKRPRMDDRQESWGNFVVSQHGIQRYTANACFSKRYSHRTFEVKRNGETVRLFSAGRPHGLQSRQDKKGETGGGLRLTKEI